MGLATALAVGGGLFSAAGSIMQGRAQSKAYEQQAKIASQNARLARLQGIRELEKGARDEQRFRRKARQFQATQRSALAASGVQMGGSALNVLADTASGIEEDASMIRFNTLQNKWQRDVQATNFLNEASAMRANASNAKTAGYIGGFASLLSSGARIAGLNANTVGGSPINTADNAIKISKAWQLNELAQNMGTNNPNSALRAMNDINSGFGTDQWVGNYLYNDWVTRQRWGLGF